MRGFLLPHDVRHVNLPRSSGVLLHPTSLPGGRLGPEAYRFVDWLEEAGQSWWQMLPVGPPDDTGSPYAAASAFAGWRELLADPGAPVAPAELEAFVAAHPYWAGDWAAYVARTGEAGTRDDGRHRKRRLSAGAGALTDQVRFQREWDALRAYAAERGVRLIGDVPLYVAPGSADRLAHPELFQEGAVAGCPPDYFTRMGQRWGNPLYDWAALRATGYRWWIERFRRTLELFDLARVDHFRGFVAYWSVPEHLRTARRGVWRRGPGRPLFGAVRAELGDLPLIAEDLGVITPAVERLRDELGLPGMHVLQFDRRVEAHRENTVVYTGTHDNDTAVGWSRDPEGHWPLVELAMSSRARVAIVPAQDVLGLGSEARMNTPGTIQGNWRWRLRPGELAAEHAARLRALAEQYRRLV
jgi:4-alpha-glucanotransferase